MPHISFSELKNWNFCPFYHKLTYIDKLKGFTGNEYTAFGTAIHDVCEKKLLKETFEATEYFLQRFEECLAELDDDVVFREDPEKGLFLKSSLLWLNIFRMVLRLYRPKSR